MFQNRIFFFLGFVLLINLSGFAQNQFRPNQTTEVDSLYREDQFYLGVTYNVLSNTPRGVRARGLSGGIQGGFLRDMPINKRRNVAVAVGVGLVYDQFGHNFFIGKEESGNSVFRVLGEGVHYDQNRFRMAMVELPIEFRWRTSTPTEYRFWRIYAGGKIGYAYWYKSSFKQEGNQVILTDIPEFKPLRLTATLGVGYSTFNFFASYNFNPFFDDAQTVDKQVVDFRALKFGIMFYIL